MTTKTVYIDSPLGKIPAIIYTPTPSVNHIAVGMCVVFFHGRGETGNGEMTGNEGLTKLINSQNHKALIDNAQKYGFTVLAPHLVPKLIGWQNSWTDKYDAACIDYALANLTELPKVGVTGLSQGGGGSWTALTSPLTADKIFACIPLCPTPQYEGKFELIAQNKIPVWNFHAVNDTTENIQSSRTMIAAANKFNPDPKIKFEELASGGHYIWSSVYERDEIYKWMLQYAPKDQTEPPTEDKILYQFKTVVYESGKIETIKL